MQIGEFAKRAGVTVQTVRFYERQKLLLEPERKDSGYRVYAERDLKRLLFIRQAKTLGFSLNEIKAILRMRDRSECPCGEVITLAETHLTSVDRQIRDLTKFRDELSRAVNKWRRSGQPTLSADAFCSLIENTMSSETKEAKRK